MNRLRGIATALVAILAWGLAGPLGNAQAGPIDLTTAGATSGIQTGANGGQFIVTQSEVQPAGTGVIDSFLRIQMRGNEQGFNTDLRTYNGPLEAPGNAGAPLDDKSDPNFTRSLLLGEVPVVNIGGTLYRQFLLDINEDQGSTHELLSLNQIQIFQNNGDPSGYTMTSLASNASQAVISFAGATEVFRLNNAGETLANGGDEIMLNAQLTHGSGSSDMFLYVLNSLFTGSATTNIILFSHFGKPPGSEGTSSGFEEWAVRQASPPDDGGGQEPVPVPPSAVLFALGFAGAGLAGLRRRMRAAA